MQSEPIEVPKNKYAWGLFLNKLRIWENPLYTNRSLDMLFLILTNAQLSITDLIPSSDNYSFMLHLSSLDLNGPDLSRTPVILV